LPEEEFPLAESVSACVGLMSDDVGDQSTVRYYCCYNMSNAETQVYNYTFCHEVEMRLGKVISRAIIGEITSPTT
jgi:hypothetical protein